MERALANIVTAPPFEKPGAFYPRTIRGPFRASKRLSNHALGLALDFDPWRNPYLSRRELALIEEISGVKLKRNASIDAGVRWDNFQRAQEAWHSKVGPWEKELAAKLRKAQAAKRKGARGARRRVKRLRQQQKLFASDNLRRAKTEGFLSLPRAFVVEMERAGLVWSTDFRPGADLMHFELRNDR